MTMAELGTWETGDTAVQTRRFSIHARRTRSVHSNPRRGTCRTHRRSDLHDATCRNFVHHCIHRRWWGNVAAGNPDASHYRPPRKRDHRGSTRRIAQLQPTFRFFRWEGADRRERGWRPFLEYADFRVRRRRPRRRMPSLRAHAEANHRITYDRGTAPCAHCRLSR